MIRTDRGVALLEVLIAMTILGIAGGALVAAASRATRATQDAIADERWSVRADGVMSALSLLTASELDLRLGSHRLGAFLVEVTRPRPRLYRVELTWDDPADAGHLTTILFRPTPPSL